MSTNPNPHPDDGFDWERREAEIFHLDDARRGRDATGAPDTDPDSDAPAPGAPADAGAGELPAPAGAAARSWWRRRTVLVPAAAVVVLGAAYGVDLLASGESPAQVRRNGNPGVHPGAVQEADPRARVRAVESE